MRNYLGIWDTAIIGNVKNKRERLSETLSFKFLKRLGLWGIGFFLRGPPDAKIRGPLKKVGGPPIGGPPRKIWGPPFGLGAPGPPKFG